MILIPQACSSDERRSFEVASGEAAETLKRYALQADIDILFSEEELRGIQTAELHGKMHPEVALQKMLTGTGLFFHLDEDSRAIAVYFPAP